MSEINTSNNPISVTEDGNNLSIRFGYDKSLLDKIRGITGRKWNAFEKVWTIPKSSAKELIDVFEDDDLEIDANIDLDYILSDDYKEDPVSVDIEPFNTVIETIETDCLRDFASWALSVLPTYFYEVAASSTGKYHPKYALGNGGLVRHTKAAVIIANELFRNNTVQNFTDTEKDCIRVALLVHDGVKHGLNGSNFTVSTHPLDVIEHITNKYSENCDTVSEGVETTMKEHWELISSCISTHMGEWNTDYKSKKEVLPTPETEMQKFTHLCDYLASRKMIEVAM